MIIEVWVVKMPNGDRPYTSAMPPAPHIAEKWREQGARIFKLREEFWDDSRRGDEPVRTDSLFPDVDRPVVLRVNKFYLGGVVMFVGHDNLCVLGRFSNLSYPPDSAEGWDTAALQVFVKKTEVSFWSYEDSSRLPDTFWVSPKGIDSFGGMKSSLRTLTEAARRITMLGKYRGPVTVYTGVSRTLPDCTEKERACAEKERADLQQVLRAQDHVIWEGE